MLGMTTLENEMQYRYKTTPTGYGTDHYGNCEVCGKRASELSMQIEERFVDDAEYAKYGMPTKFWTHDKCRAPTIGHEQCLVAIQRDESSPNV